MYDDSPRVWVADVAVQGAYTLKEYELYPEEADYDLLQLQELLDDAK